MAKSIKVNFIFNLINTVSGLLFPLITFPYASRIIMADGIGQVSFLSSIINYIVIFSSIGIPLYGIREIARVRDNYKELSRTTFEIISLNLILNVLGYIAIAIICLTIERVQENSLLFLVLSSSIILTTLGCSWFYSGIEEFKYITIRNLIIKILSVGFLLIAVQTPDDLLYYGFYTVLGTIGNNVLNFFRLRKHISLRVFKIQDVNIWKHLKPALAVFLFNLITSIYLNLDKVMLGFMQDDMAVGYYTAATNLSHVILYGVTSLGAVLLPRSSYLIKNNRFEEFGEMSQKAYRFVVLLACPLMFGTMCLSEPLIHMFCGNNFDDSIKTLFLISPIILFIGVSNIIGMQVLYPLGMIKIVTISTCVGAASNFICNLLLIPSLSQDGAAIATVVAEMSVMITQIFIGRKYIPFKIIDSTNLKYLLFSIIMYFVCTMSTRQIESELLNIIFIPVIGILVYMTLLLMAKDKMINDGINIIKSKTKL